jgi:hypothetical protein
MKSPSNFWILPFAMTVVMVPTAHRLHLARRRVAFCCDDGRFRGEADMPDSLGGASIDENAE